MPIPP